MAATANTTIAALAQLDDRDIKALTEPFDLIGNDPACREDQVAVYHRGQRRIVDPDVGVCDCPDMLHRRPDDGCKHLRAVWFATGELEVPPGIDRAALADHIAHGVVADA